MITIYSKNNCNYCSQAKEYLDHLNIPYKEINIDEDAKAKEFIKSEGHSTVPQIYLNTELLIQGGYSGLMTANIDELIDVPDIKKRL